MRIFLASLLFGISIGVSAQNDKIYLENGSVVRGTILQETPTDTILISISGKVIPVPLEIVDEIRFRKRNGVRPGRYNDLVYQSGFATVVEAGTFIGNHTSGDSLKLRPALELAQEYHHHPFLNGGIAVGMHFYHRYTVFPVTIHYQALLGKRHNSWLIYGKAGYGFIQSRFEQENLTSTGGLLFQTGIGWQQRIGKNSFRIRLGYSAQTVKDKQEFGTYFITRERRMNRINVTVAYVFRY